MIDWTKDKEVLYYNAVIKIFKKAMFALSLIIKNTVYPVKRRNHGYSDPRKL